MRRAAYLVIMAGASARPLTPVRAEQTLQQRYLDIYLKINDAEHLERQGDFRGALEDFQDCYTKLSKIHTPTRIGNRRSSSTAWRIARPRFSILKPKADAQPLPRARPGLRPGPRRRMTMRGPALASRPLPSRPDAGVRRNRQPEAGIAGRDARSSTSRRTS